MTQLKKIQRVKMLKTRAPKKIPNGSIGGVIGPKDIRKYGLHLVEFDCGFAAFVTPDEVEIINNEGR